MRTVFALLRSVLVACFLVFTAARGAKGSVKDDILSLTGGARTKVVWRLVDRFKGDEAVEALEGYGLLKRLLDEQCEVVEEPVAPAEGDADSNEPRAPVVVKAAKEVRSDSLQTPHDPSLTYSGKVRVFFDGKACEGCPHRDSCPAKPLRDGRRVLRTSVRDAVLVKRGLRRRHRLVSAEGRRWRPAAGAAPVHGPRHRHG